MPSKQVSAGGGGFAEDEPMAEELHVLFGGGQVGQPLARILLERGKRVRIVKRSAGGVPEGAFSPAMITAATIGSNFDTERKDVRRALPPNRIDLPFSGWREATRT
jgi:siroheme synthase (precorrin-2 oxidase/ferrochelatase)